MTKNEIIRELGKPKSNELMDVHHYWYIIQDSIDNSNNQEEQESFLIDELSKLKPNEIIGFFNRTTQLINELNTNELFSASIIINYWNNEDIFSYFRTWIISLGKKTFNLVKQDPDNLVDNVNPNIPFHQFADFQLVPYEAFENVTGENIYDFISSREDGRNDTFKFDWLFDNPDEIAKVCPKLYSLFEQTNVVRKVKEIESWKVMAKNLSISKSI